MLNVLAFFIDNKTCDQAAEKEIPKLQSQVQELKEFRKTFGRTAVVCQQTKRKWQQIVGVCIPCRLLSKLASGWQARKLARDTKRGDGKKERDVVHTLARAMVSGRIKTPWSKC